MSEIKLTQDALRKSIAKAQRNQTESVKPIGANQEELDVVEGDSEGEELCISDTAGELEKGMKWDEEENAGDFSLEEKEICDLADEAKEHDDDW